MSVTGQRTHETKECAECGVTFAKLAKYSRLQWSRARFCSRACKARTSVKESATLWPDGRYRVRRNGKWIYRARAVVEDALGPLPAGAVVHHINRDHTDDRLENLRVFASNSEHMRFHALQGDCGFQPGHAPHQQQAA